MSKRLQILLDERELRDIRRAANRAGQTVSEWARQAMRAHARAGGSNADPARKLAVIQSAAAHAFPTAEIDEMLAQIEAGYAETKPA
ncbi:hypothetical protein Gocc_0551 [Gaiella occulta]|uniref:Ribbon-helix-helix protein, copG family n=1 Tax=Gaiella occulta TaxID=1002870 RepID=A0A7M2Z2F8_9ACTN|nr:antitoxin [Gaiella occulta]RDI76132.1 hypothetical protein Gocc_0551 [Gaiella occulta]